MADSNHTTLLVEMIKADHRHSWSRPTFALAVRQFSQAASTCSRFCREAPATIADVLEDAIEDDS